MVEMAKIIIPIQRVVGQFDELLSHVTPDSLSWVHVDAIWWVGVRRESRERGHDEVRIHREKGSIEISVILVALVLVAKLDREHDDLCWRNSCGSCDVINHGPLFH